MRSLFLYCCIFNKIFAEVKDAVNVYDFDNTIYKGDSTLDFYFFCVKKKPIILKYLPVQIGGYIAYKAKIVEKTIFKTKFFSFIKGIESIDKMVKLFWDYKQNNIKNWYIEKKLEDDVIISASPEFLLKEICIRLKIDNLIASDVDSKTGRFLSENCYGIEKVMRFSKEFPDGVIDEFYSDSYSDLPMAKISKKAFIVKGELVNEWKK